MGEATEKLTELEGIVQEWYDKDVIKSTDSSKGRGNITIGMAEAFQHAIAYRNVLAKIKEIKEK